MSALLMPCRTEPSAAESAAGAHAFPPFEPPLADARAPARALLLAECLGDARQPVETLIRARFADAYDARVKHFMPRLFSLHHRPESPMGAFGVREAGDHALFLERYLDLPVEAAIADRVGQPVARHEIVEVGQFAGTGPGAFRTLIVRLTEALHHEGHRWVVFTGTAALRNAFLRLGLAPLELAPADATRLAASERADWGSYYKHSPRVMCGDIGQGFAAIARRAGAV